MVIIIDGSHGAIEECNGTVVSNNIILNLN